METRKMPGGAMARRPLHYFLLLDTSGSMNANGKIEALNNAVRMAIPTLREVAEKNPAVRVLMQAVTFSTEARWHIQEPTGVEIFRWTDVAAGGETSMGAAFELVSEALTLETVGARALAPVLVLVSDGRPTDDFKGGLRKLMSTPWGSAAVRVAVAIGSDADLKYLQQFIGDDSVKPARANRPEALVDRIRDVSRDALETASTAARKRSAPVEEKDDGESIW